MKKYYEIHNDGAGAVFSEGGVKLIILNGNPWQEDLLSPLMQIEDLNEYLSKKPVYHVCFGQVQKGIPDKHWEALKNLVEVLTLRSCQKGKKGKK